MSATESSEERASDRAVRSRLRDFTFLVNPSAGGGRASGAFVPVAKILREAGAEVDVVFSPGVAAMRELAGAAVAAGRVVVAVGGDGMVSSVAGVMAGLSSAGGLLGLVPAGRGNDFARMLRIPDTPEAVAERLLHAEPVEVDLIDCGGTLVAGSVYAGVDAEAAARVARMRRIPAAAQYPLGAVGALLRYVPNRYRITVDGESLELDAATVVVANSRYYGSGMMIAPRAELADGELDVIVIGAASRIRLIRAFPSIYDGSHVQRSDVTMLRATEVLLAARSRRPVPLGGDGEELGTLPGPDDEPLRIAVRPCALRVL